MKWFEAGDGHTPLDRDETRGLRVPVSTRAQLNALEQRAIIDGLTWAYGRRGLKDSLLTVSGLLVLHERMFAGLWAWAGQPRATEKNIGVAPHDIMPQLKAACDDARFWFAEAVYPAREIAVRFHHRLVRIHIFPNGNGRHARATADLLLHHRQAQRIVWPTERAAYIAALREADVRRYGALIALLAPSAESAPRSG